MRQSGLDALWRLISRIQRIEHPFGLDLDIQPPVLPLGATDELRHLQQQGRRHGVCSDHGADRMLDHRIDEIPADPDMRRRHLGLPQQLGDLAP